MPCPASLVRAGPRPHVRRPDGRGTGTGPEASGFGKDHEDVHAHRCHHDPHLRRGFFGPLFVFAFLVALGIDHNIFLTTGVHEEAERQGTRRGVVTGLAATGAVITSAGLVPAGTVAALGTLPLVGFAVTLGVLLDTSIVRSILVTALFQDVGPKVW